MGDVRTRQPYCHTLSGNGSPKGEMLSVFFSCLVLCPLSFFAVFLFLGSLFGINYRERTFAFGCRC